MPLNKTPVYRNLRTQVTFCYLEFEDLVVILLIAPLAFFLGSFFNRDLFGIPMKLVLQWGIPAIAVVFVVTFKYGKPRGYVGDWWTHLTKPHVYCGLEQDSQLNLPYLIDSEGE